MRLETLLHYDLYRTQNLLLMWDILQNLLRLTCDFVPPLLFCSTNDSSLIEMQQHQKDYYLQYTVKRSSINLKVIRNKRNYFNGRQGVDF